MSAGEDLWLKDDLSVIVVLTPGVSKKSLTRMGSPDKMAAWRGAHPRGWRAFASEGNAFNSL